MKFINAEYNIFQTLHGDFILLPDLRLMVGQVKSEYITGADLWGMITRHGLDDKITAVKLKDKTVSGLTVELAFYLIVCVCSESTEGKAFLSQALQHTLLG